MMSTPDLGVILSLAKEASLVASPLILSAFRAKEFHAWQKPDRSLVTDIDIRAEEMIRNFLGSAESAKWPVSGEEFGEDVQSERFRWLIDPIDGTLSFPAGLPTFGTIIAFEDCSDGRALAGVIHLPAFGATYYAARDRGAFCNDVPIHVAAARPLEHCLISTPDAVQFRISRLDESYLRLRERVDHLRGYTDCWSHAMVATGAIDAIFEPYMNRWDIAATEVLVEEAGGLCLTRRPQTPRAAIDAIFGVKEVVTEIAALTSF